MRSCCYARTVANMSKSIEDNGDEDRSDKDDDKNAFEANVGERLPPLMDHGVARISRDC